MAQPLPERCPSEADRVHLIIERLYELMPIISNERRHRAQSDTLLDGYTELGRMLCRMGRG